MPTGVAQDYHVSPKAPPSGPGPAAAAVQPEMDPAALGRLHLECLWEVSDAFRSAVDALCRQDLERLSGADLVRVLRENGVADLFPEFTAQELVQIQKDGKIPKLERWRERLERGSAGLDALVNLAGLLSFATDQAELDARVRGLLA
jgi:transaldolase